MVAATLEMMPLQPLPEASRKALLDLLLVYFCDSEINGTVANIPKLAFSQQDWTAGWIPSATLASFKRLQSITKDPRHITLTAIQLAPSIFEASEDGSKLRRRMPFDAKFAAEAAARESIAQNFVEATGFAKGTTPAEVQSYFSQFGPVIGVRVSGRAANGVFWIEFANGEDMITVLARPHLYEDAVIQVQGRGKVLAGAEQLLSMGGEAGYPRNRVVRFLLQSDAHDYNRSINKPALKSALEQFAVVHSIELDKDASTGYVRFKKSVAREVLDIVGRQGGLKVSGESVQLAMLMGDEERLYWSVARQKEADAAAAAAVEAQSAKAVSDAAAAAGQPVSKQVERQAGRKQRRTKRGPYSQTNGRNKAATPKKGKQGVQKQESSATVPSTTGKVKVDDLQALFQNL
ncbi:hypothetical protein DFS34DRAFT_704013 [Phlyctochytrium arcticum]|nr:hypothetical protein DFS34DRAFT_704013 [Phlyctochytrium arcticum]